MAEQYTGPEQRHVPRTPVSDVGYDRYKMGTTIKVSSVTVGTSAAIHVKTNPNRVSLIVINNSANIVYANFSPAVASDFGMVLSAGGGGFRMVIDDEGEAVINEVWMVSGTAGSKCTVIETVVGGG